MSSRKKHNNLQQNNSASQPYDGSGAQDFYESSSTELQENELQKRLKKRSQRKSSYVLGMFVLFGVLCVVAIFWQKLGPQSAELSAKALSYSFDDKEVVAPRGDILSDDYRVLITSTAQYELRMDLNAPGLSRKIKEGSDSTLFDQHIDSLAYCLADFFGDTTAAAYKDMIVNAPSNRRGYLRLNPRKINYLELRKVREFPLLNLPPNVGGFIPREIARRARPYGELASRTLGFVNTSGYKVGIEGAFDHELKGRNGVVKQQKVSGDFWIPIPSPYNIEPLYGANIVTTIDIDVQDIVQRALRAQVDSVEAMWGCAMVMEVATGEIKAIANVTRDQETGEMREDYNYAVGMSLDPGSTFKLPVLMALMEDDVCDLSTMVDAGGGREKIGYATVVDTKPGGYGKRNLKSIFEVSSNIGMAKLVTENYGKNPSRFVDLLENMGVAADLNLQIKGAAKPTLHRPRTKGWDGMTVTMMSYGYALRITPLHTLAFYNAVANKGNYMRPLLVKEVWSEGQKVQEFKPDTLIENIASKKVIDDAHQALVGVVENGTARMLKNDRYGVAAKTGTAQVAMGRSGYGNQRGDRYYLGSMAGYFPAENPKYSIVIAIQTFRRYGSGKAYYGVALSGPPFRDIMEHIYNWDHSLREPQNPFALSGEGELSAQKGNSEMLRSIEKQLGVKGSLPQEPRTKGRDSVEVANYCGYALSDALEALQRAGHRVRVEGQGEIVEQILERDTITGGSTVVLKLKGSSRN